MTNTLKKIRLLALLAVFLTLTNCQEEYNAIQNSAPQNGITRKVLIGTDANAVASKLKPYLKSKGNKAMAALSKLQGHEGASLRTFADVESMIDYSQAVEITYPNGDVNYTFAFNEPKATEEVFYNLVIKKSNGFSKSLIIRYVMDPAFAYDYNNGKLGFEKFTGTMSFELLDVDEGFPCGDEPDISIPVSGGKGPGSAGGSGGSSSGGGGSGGSSGGGGSGYGYSQTVVDMEYLSLQLVVVANNDPDDDDSGDEDDDEDWIEVSRSPRYFRTGNVPELINPNDPCGGGEEIGIVEPKLDPSPCIILNDLKNNANIKASLNTLSSDDYINGVDEHLFAFTKSPNGNTMATPEVSHTGTSANAAISVRTYGVAHIHQKGTNTLSGTSSQLYQMLSFTDVGTVYNIAKGNMGTGLSAPPLFFNMMVIDNYTYAVVPNDVEALKNMSNIFEDVEKVKRLNAKLNRIYDINCNPTDVDPVTISHQTLAPYFLMFMNNAGDNSKLKSGINFNVSLYRISNNDNFSGKWEKLELDPENNYQLKITPCN